MPHRVGISTDIPTRLAFWRSKLRNIREVEKHGPFPSKEAAQAWENSFDASWDSGDGGDNPDDPTKKWYGYTFTHDGDL